MTQTRYGQGTITMERGRFRVRLPDGNGGHTTIGIYDTEREAKQMQNAALLARGHAAVGTTLRQWGESWLHRIRDHKSIDQTIGTALSVPLHSSTIRSLNSRHRRCASGQTSCI